MSKYKVLFPVIAIVFAAAACNSTSQTSQTPPPPPAMTPSEVPPPAPVPTPTPTPTPVSPTPTPSPTPSPTTSVQISMTSSGFSPAEVTVKPGTTVVFKNTDTQAHWPASNPHPVHTDLPGFDAKKGIAPGGSYSFVFSKVGVWGFHDHMHPSNGGHVTVAN